MGELLNGSGKASIEQVGPGRPEAGSQALEHDGGDLRQALRKLEAQILREALQRYGTQSKAARHLGVAQATIARKSKLYGLDA